MNHQHPRLGDQFDRRQRRFGIALGMSSSDRDPFAITQYEQALDALNDRGADQELRNSILANLRVARQISSTPAPAST